MNGECKKKREHKTEKEGKKEERTTSPSSNVYMCMFNSVHFNINRNINMYTEIQTMPQQHSSALCDYLCCCDVTQPKLYRVYILTCSRGVHSAGCHSSQLHGPLNHSLLVGDWFNTGLESSLSMIYRSNNIVKNDTSRPHYISLLLQ